MPCRRHGPCKQCQRRCWRRCAAGAGMRCSCHGHERMRILGGSGLQPSLQSDSILVSEASESAAPTTCVQGTHRHQPFRASLGPQQHTSVGQEVERGALRAALRAVPSSSESAAGKRRRCRRSSLKPEITAHLPCDLCHLNEANCRPWHRQPAACPVIPAAPACPRLWPDTSCCSFQAAATSQHVFECTVGHDPGPAKGWL